MTSREPLAPPVSRAQLRTLGMVWITYGTFYFCRVNIGPARTEIEHGLGINALEMGFVLGSLKIGYAVGQFFNGQLAEKFGAKRVLVTGMFGSVIACTLFALSPRIAELAPVAAALPAMARAANGIAHVFAPSVTVGSMAALLFFLWFVNGLFQAGGWPPSVMIMSRWFSTAQRGRTMGILGTSYQLGSVITIVAVGYIVGGLGLGWQMVFFVPAAALLVSAIHTAWRLREAPSEGEAPSMLSTAIARARRSLPLRETLMITLGNGRLWLLAFGLFGLDLVRFGFLDWAPTHLKEVHGSGVGVAALKSAVFPLAGALGALVSGWATDRFFQSRRAPVIAGALLMVGLLTLTYGRVVMLGVVPTLVVLSLIGFFLYGAQILLVGTAAQDFARGGAAAAAAGFVDFTGSMGAFAGDVVTGWMLKNRDWHQAIQVWAGAAIVASLLVATLWNAKPRAET